MSRRVRHSVPVQEYLRTSPFAEEARVLIECVARDNVPSGAVKVPGTDSWFFLLEDSRRVVWWRDEPTGLLVESIGEPP